MTVEPATLDIDDGQPASRRYGDVYASRAGALEQARHVFLGGNDLPARWAGREQFVVVETGFGLGVNFLATWQCWRDDPQRPRRLHFVSVERHPLAATDLQRAVPAPLQPLASLLAAQWPLPLPGLHRLEFEEAQVVLTLAFGDAGELVPQLALGADAFFLDGFAPDRNPAMWSPLLLKALARMARPGATLATWCTAAAVRESLTAGGFAVEKRRGFGRKREMLTARFAPRWTVRRHEPPLPRGGERRALIVGAGLAGCSVAQSLARRGWQVELFDAGGKAASGASALPWGLLHPQIARDDNRLARLTRAGFLLGTSQLARLPDAASLWQRCGVLQQARDDEEAAAMVTALEALRWPPQHVRWLDAAEATARIGVAPRRGGYWFEQGGIVSAQQWCRAMAGSVPLRPSAVASAELHSDGWLLRDQGGRELGAAPVLVIAAALASPQLAAMTVPLTPVRGRLSILPGEALPLRAGLAGEGYLLRAPDGFTAAGASYEFEPEAGACWASDDEIHRGNLQRLQRLLAQPPSATPTGMFDGMRCVAHDRLPLAGPVADEASALSRAEALRGAQLADLPRQPGLYASFAFGSRGLTLAPLAAELIAAQLEGEPWPIERDLAAAIDPARFLLRRLRSGRAT